MTTTREYIVKVHREEDGMFWAEVLDLPGCFASGESLDVLREALEEAISLYLHDAPDARHIDPIESGPAVSRQGNMEVDEIRVKVPA